MPYDKNRPLQVICRTGKRPEITVYVIVENMQNDHQRLKALIIEQILPFCAIRHIWS